MLINQALKNKMASPYQTKFLLNKLKTEKQKQENSCIQTNLSSSLRLSYILIFILSWEISYWHEYTIQEHNLQITCTLNSPTIHKIVFFSTVLSQQKITPLNDWFGSIVNPEVFFVSYTFTSNLYTKYFKVSSQLHLFIHSYIAFKSHVSSHDLH